MSDDERGIEEWNIEECAIVLAMFVLRGGGQEDESQADDDWDYVQALMREHFEDWSELEPYERTLEICRVAVASLIRDETAVVS